MECRICGEEVPNTGKSMYEHLENHSNEYEEIYQKIRDFYNDTEE